MAQVPFFNQPSVGDKHIAHGYDNAYVNPEAFNNVKITASSTASKISAFLADKAKTQYDKLSKAKIVEITNNLDSYAQQVLYDKDNGYFYKTGKNAMGQSPVIMQGYDNYAKKLLDESGLSSDYLLMAKNTVNSKRNNINEYVNRYDKDQTDKWQNSIFEEKENNILNKAILDRNDDNQLSENLRQGILAIKLHGENQNWDDDTINLKIQDFTSKFHENVINSRLADGSLSAKNYYETFKNQISESRHNAILNSVNNNELKYKSNALADKYLSESKDETEALEKAYMNENIDIADATASRIRQKSSEKRRLENQAESDALDNFYNIVLQKKQSGEALSIDDIPDDEHITAKTKLSLMSYIQSEGNPKTDNEYWEMLYNMRINNAQGFAGENLNKYRGYLSDSDYKYFVKQQEDIKTGKFYSNIKDDDKLITDALHSIGLKSDKKQASAFSEIRALTRELEARKGRKITDDELLNITSSLGYKGNDGVLLYKQLEKGMAERVGFVRDVMNDFVYYQSQHNGQMPPDSEKYKIITKRISGKIQEQNNEISSVLNEIGSSFEGHRITSKYGLRTAPKEGASTNHKGIDLRYSNNEPFSAFEAGVVVDTGFNSRIGNFVDIKDSSGIIHRYGHANKILVSRGMTINKGDIIGKAGSTGISTGPHVHYATLKNGQFINPVDLYNNKQSKNSMSEKIAVDSNGNRAIVQVDNNGNIVKVVREI